MQHFNAFLSFHAQSRFHQMFARVAQLHRFVQSTASKGRQPQIRLRVQIPCKTILILRPQLTHESSTPQPQWFPQKSMSRLGVSVMSSFATWAQQFPKSYFQASSELRYQRLSQKSQQTNGLNNVILKSHQVKGVLVNNVIDICLNHLHGTHTPV